jgi:hypothetical protein
VACIAESLEGRTLRSLDGNQLFPSDNPWNHPITDAPVAANSTTLVNSIGASSPLHPDFGTTYGGTLNGIPYNVVTGTQPKTSVVIDAYPDESDQLPVPIPDGAVIEGDPPAGVTAFSQVPAFVQVSMTNQDAYCWTPSTTDARALSDPTTVGNRFASSWNSTTSFTVDLDFTDGQAHRVAFYLLDWDSQGRTETVDVINPATSKVLTVQAVSNFSGGEYLVFDLTGNVELKFTNTNSAASAVLSGIFFGAPGSPGIGGSTGASASFVTTDKSTQGAWQSAYGANGYDLAFPQAEGDRHLIVYDSTNNIAYELYNAHRPSEEPDGQWHADSEAVWDLSQDSFRPPGWTSADAAGLPILTGLVRPDETLTQGVITHALRFTVPKSDDAYVFPASHEAGINNSALPRMGERFRLNPSFNISGYPAADQVILQALKTYGMIVADNGSPWYISGSPSDQWDDSTLHHLTQVIGSDFQAVDLAPVVSGLSQSSGASGGGNTVTISGVDFQGVAGQLQVSFGTVAATNIKVLSDNTLTVTVPSQAVGTKVDVTITTPYGTSATSSADKYTYTASIAPVVTHVSVDSTQWSASFPYAAGYAIPTGSAQLTDLPWVNLNQVNMTFNQGVNVTQASLTVAGVNQAGYTISGFSYNSTTFTATWTFAAPLAADKLLLDLAATGPSAVTSAVGGVALDGTWTNGVSKFPSGGNSPGTDFKYNLNVLPGDVAQTGGPVNILDVIKTRNLQLTSPGNGAYSPFYDVDGSGSINILDVIDVRNRQLSSLPAGSPL